MKPIDYVKAIGDAYQGLGNPSDDWTINHDLPFSQLEKPMCERCVSVLTLGGISIADWFHCPNLRLLGTRF